MKLRRIRPVNGRLTAVEIVLLKSDPIVSLISRRIESHRTIRSSAMAARVTPPVYTTFGFWVLVIGIVLVILSSFAAVDVPIVDIFKLGVGLCFASFLIR